MSKDESAIDVTDASIENQNNIDHLKDKKDLKFDNILNSSQDQTMIVHNNLEASAKLEKKLFARVANLNTEVEENMNNLYGILFNKF